MKWTRRHWTNGIERELGCGLISVTTKGVALRSVIILRRWSTADQWSRERWWRNEIDPVTRDKERSGELKLHLLARQHQWWWWSHQDDGSEIASVCLSIDSSHINVMSTANLARIDTNVSRDVTETDCPAGLRIELSVKTNQWCIINVPRRLTSIYTWFTTSIVECETSGKSRCASHSLSPRAKEDGLTFKQNNFSRSSSWSHRDSTLRDRRCFIKDENEFSLMVTFLPSHWPRMSRSCYQIEYRDAIETGAIDDDPGSFPFSSCRLSLINGDSPHGVNTDATDASPQRLTLNMHPTVASPDAISRQSPSRRRSSQQSCRQMQGRGKEHVDQISRQLNCWLNIRQTTREINTEILNITHYCRARKKWEEFD